MGDILAPQSGALAVVRQSAALVKSPSGQALGIIQYPADFAQAAQVGALAVVRGKVSSPKVRAWTFSLDGHDFYVLRVGDIETLVYDVTAKEWYEWGSGEDPVWSVATGFTWYGGRRMGAAFGTNIVVGSDFNGTLYFLSPNDNEDDDAVLGNDLKRPFVRQIVGQAFVESGYDFIPCFGVQVFGSVGQSLGDVTLEISDDRGDTYENMGALSVPADRQYRLEWQSLGSLRAPGRLFRITDNGALRRIDGLEMVTPDA